MLSKKCFNWRLALLTSWLLLLCSGSFSHHVKFYSFMFMYNISTQVVCVNGMHTSGVLFFPSPVAESCIRDERYGKKWDLGNELCANQNIGVNTPYHLIFVYIFSLSRLALRINFNVFLVVFKKHILRSMLSCVSRARKLARVWILLVIPYFCFLLWLRKGALP